MENVWIVSSALWQKQDGVRHPGVALFTVVELDAGDVFMVLRLALRCSTGVQPSSEDFSPDAEYSLVS